MNTLEAEITISALHSIGNYLVLRRLDLERDSTVLPRDGEYLLPGAAGPEAG
jgi:hypothetical protein